MPEIVKLIEFRDREGVYAAWRWKADETTNVTKWDQLVVRENQICVLMQEGKVQEHYGPGRYSLDSKNFPLLTKFLTGLVFGSGVTPFIADLYFLNTTQFNARRWGTSSPVFINDELYGQTPITANGTAGYGLINAEPFHHKVIGTQDCITVADLDRIARDTIIIPAFLDAIVALNKSRIQDVINSRTVIIGELTNRANEAMKEFGLKLTGLTINSIGTTPEYEAIMADAALARAKAGANAFGISRVTEAQAEAEKRLGAVGSSYREVTVADAVKVGAASGSSGVLGALLVSQTAQMAAATPSAVPPAAPSNQQFYAVINNQQVGPLAAAIFQQMSQAGVISVSTLVWRQGMAGWQAAGSVAELANTFAPATPQAPPPIPAKNQ